MKNIQLNQLYSCDKKFYKKKINCNHWSYDTNSCVSFCSLKNINPSLRDCSNCSDISYIEDIETTEKIVDQPKGTFGTKVSSYAKAEVSQFTQGKVSEEIFNKRKDFCMSCERRKNPHPEGESIGWCTNCGCGITPRAALSQKLYIPTISCPLNKFGPEKGEGFNAKDAIDSVKGIATSVKSLFEKDK